MKRLNWGRIASWAATLLFSLLAWGALGYLVLFWLIPRIAGFIGIGL